MLKTMAITCIILLIGLMPSQGARTYIVDDDGFANYDTIGDAVAAANDGDTIFIKPGIYREEVVLNKMLILMPLTGETGPCILDGEEKSIGIKVNSDGCTIEGLTIANFTGPGIYLASKGNAVRENEFVNDRLGVFLKTAEENVIENNVVRDCETGIALYLFSKGNVIRKNAFENCAMAVILNQVESNTVTENQASACFQAFNLTEASRNEIVGNSLTDSLVGVKLYNSNENVVQESVVENSTGAFVIAGCSGNRIERNTLNVSYDGIFMVDSDHNTLADNNILNSQSGITVVYSKKNELKSNELQNTGFGLYVYGSSKEDFDNNIDESNLIDGKPIVYSFEGKDLVIKERKLSHVSLAHCQNCTVEGNSITNDAILLFNSTGCRIANNNVTGCYGISVLSSRDNQVYGNIAILNRGNGIYMTGSDSNEIKENTLSRNNKSGAEIVSSKSNMISGNFMEANENDGLWMNLSKDNQVYKNTLSENGQNGARMVSSSSNVFKDNMMKANGISGLSMNLSKDNQVYKNTLSENGQNGLRMVNSSSNVFNNNIMDANGEAGLWMNLSHQNQIYENVVSSNLVGAYLANSFDNQIYHNDFLDNGEQAEDRLGSNAWDMGNMTGGNYWSDHSCTGNPCEGFAKLIRGGAIDRYPFQEQSAWK